MKKKVCQFSGLTIQLTLLQNACYIFVTQSLNLQINTWRVGLQTPYQQLPSVINLDQGLTSNQTIDNMVKSITKKIALPTVASINLPPELIQQNFLLNLNKAIVQNINQMKCDTNKQQKTENA